MKRLVLGMALSGIATLLPAARLAGQQTQVYPDVLNEVKHDTSPPMRDLHAASPEQGPPRVIKLFHTPHEVKQGQVDPVVQSSAGTVVSAAPTTNTNGISANGILPSDANGAVGATQYVQWVNTSYAVFDKASGVMTQAPRTGKSIWTGFGGPCESYNFGDPIAQYDKAANRWVMAQPVFTAPYMYCLAVSTTSDATGAYHRYAFSMPNFPDYPKVGVWPDAYYASINLFQGNNFVGAYACAFDRNAMLNGLAATAQCFNNPSEASFLPSDLDGSTPPPAGSPNYFVDLNPTSLAALNLYKFHVDFSNSAKSTFTGPTSIPVAAFNEACSQFTYTQCIPQPLYQGIFQETLDSLPDRLMYRLAYRNFGDHESLVASHSVNANGAVGVRWYELRNPGGSPTIYQQGTYAPDSNYRWMGSAAMDHSGDIAIGYSISSTGLNPSIRYAGRVPSDPLGTLEAENSIVEGAYEQINQYRWGDYTSMSVDPVDDCTFWYTNQYMGASSWLTQIASFKFPSCGSAPSPDFSLSASPASATVVQGNGTAYSVGVNPLNGFTGSVSFSTGSLPSGVSASFSPTVSSSSTTMSVTTSSSTPAGTYTIAVTGTDGSLSHTVNVTLVVTDFSISAAPSPQSVNRGSNATYTTSVVASGGFAGTVNLSVSGLPRRASASFSPSSITGSGTSAMTVSVPKKASAGTYQLTITGTSGSLAHSATVILAVN